MGEVEVVVAEPLEPNIVAKDEGEAVIAEVVITEVGGEPLKPNNVGEGRR